ncbi:MAG: hypothetical protein CMI85_00925 [Candidatus Pelagibacter sp.]|nr:hypothetical protein [Candidatus Pelagibacter sp.]
MKSKFFNIFTFFIIFILFALGTWQVHRLKWKNELIDELSKSYEKSVKNFNINSKLYSKVEINGKIIGQPIFVYNLSDKGQYGYEVYIPIETKYNVVISRVGWVDKKFKLLKDDLYSKKKFNGILLNPKRKNIFTPDNSPDLTFFIDMELLQYNYQKKLFPLIVETRSEFLENYNLKKPLKIKLPNNHLQYALTWYSLCFVIFIAFLIYKRKI